MSYIKTGDPINKISPQSLNNGTARIGWICGWLDKIRKDLRNWNFWGTVQRRGVHVNTLKRGSRVGVFVFGGISGFYADLRRELRWGNLNLAVFGVLFGVPRESTEEGGQFVCFLVHLSELLCQLEVNCVLLMEEVSIKVKSKVWARDEGFTWDMTRGELFDLLWCEWVVLVGRIDWSEIRKGRNDGLRGEGVGWGGLWCGL
jgi:hypothetical protein